MIETYVLPNNGIMLATETTNKIGATVTKRVNCIADCNHIVPVYPSAYTVLLDVKW
jgi:hypothetical protein